jgi:hypothetical protein
MVGSPLRWFFQKSHRTRSYGWDIPPRMGAYVVHGAAIVGKLSHSLIASSEKIRQVPFAKWAMFSWKTILDLLGDRYD